MTPPDIINDRRLELVKRIQTVAPTDTPPANERIARLVQLRSETLPLFGTSGLVSTKQVRDFGAAQRELLDLTYQDLQRLTQPFYIGIHEFFDYLKYHPKELAYSYSSPRAQHMGIVLPAEDPNLRWFVDLSHGRKQIRDPKSNEPRTISRRVRSLLGLDPKIQIDMVKTASFLLADAGNIGHLFSPSKHDTYGFSIGTSVYYDRELDHDSSVLLNDSGRMTGITKAIGINFVNPGITRAIVSYPDGLGDKQIASYPLQRLSKEEVIYKIGHVATYGHNFGRAIVNRYKLAQDGLFRRNGFNPDDPTIQEEIDNILQQLPHLPHRLTETAETEEKITEN